MELQPLPCDDTPSLVATRRPALLAGFSGRAETVQLDAPPGSYLLSAFMYWERPDGTTGDVHATAGIQIDETGARGIVDASEIRCRPPQLPT